MDGISAPDYEFGGFCLDTALQALISRDGEPMALPSRAYDVLLQLVERAGELVEKSTLMAAVWPRTVVEENNLSQCILTLRKALGETLGERRFILTVPGRGFKFVAPVRIVPRVQRGVDSNATARPAVEPRSSSWASPESARLAGPPRRRLLIAGAALLAGVLGLAGWLITASPHPVTRLSEYQPLTDVDDSATAPALSPDGRMLAFIRGGESFLSSGQIWLKVLPNGAPVRLTHTSDPIFGPVFTPDGTQVAYTTFGLNKAWDTWVVPITGGTPVRFLPNASGLSFIGPHEVMYSEFKSGIHLGVAVSMDDRSRHRDIYLPAHERGMAHFSYLSPDRKSVLVVEMGPTGKWGRCRLVPFDGHSAGEPVGPAGACRFAAWSPDGRWMYFSALVAEHSHLWRQRYPNGVPEQITFGPTEEETVVASPDGHSLISSVTLGHDQDRIWIHDASGERALTTEGYAHRPWLSDDTRRIYFLAATSSTDASGLSRLDIASGRREALLAGIAVTDYAISYDERLVAFTTQSNAAPQVWVAPLDRDAPPKLLVRGGDQVAFDRSGHIFFRNVGDHANYLNRMNADGSHNVRVLATPIFDFQSVSPDGTHVTVSMRVSGALGATWLIPLDGGEPRLLERGWWPSRFSRDGRYLYIEGGDNDSSQAEGRTIALPLDIHGVPLQPVRPIPADATVIQRPEQSLAIGPSPTVYAFEKRELRRNIYRIPLH